MTYQEYLQSPEWKAKTEECKRRAGNRCQVCNTPYNLEAHHRTYERLGDELQEDLTALCRECHALFSKHHRMGLLINPAIIGDYKPLSLAARLARMGITL